MYICLNCKEQFSDAITRYGDCPYCGTVSMLAQERKNLEGDVLHKNYLRLKRRLNHIKKSKIEEARLGR